MKTQIEIYETELIPAMSSIELLEELKDAARSNVRGSHAEDIALIEAELLKRLS